MTQSKENVPPTPFTRRRFISVALLSGAGVALSACARSGDTAATQTATSSPTPTSGRTAAPAGTLDIVLRGEVPRAHFTPAIARAKGYFEEVGIDERAVPVIGGPESTQALAAGQLDVGGSTNVSAFFNAHARGVGVRFVCDSWHLAEGERDSFMVVLRKDIAEGISTPPAVTDLRGLVNAHNSPLDDGGSSYVAEQMFIDAGMDFDTDVQWEHITVSTMGAALANRGIDAGWMFEPFVTFAVQQDLGVRWLNLGNFVPGAQIAGYNFSERFIDERTDVARRWMVANVRAIRDYNDFLKGENREEIGAILAEYTGLDSEDVLNEVAWPGIDPDGRFNIPEMMDAQDYMLRRGSIEQIIPGDQVVDEQFVEFAVEELGPYSG